MERKVQVGNSRRDFLKKTAMASAVLPGFRLFDPSWSLNQRITAHETGIPWYRRVTRWGQTNITEKDPPRYDIDWWRQYWKRTKVQGVIVNAGGIVAYYPSHVPLHRQAEYLEGRDLFGDLCRAAHDQGLAVFARMDSNRAHEDFFRTHPDWFATDADGKPFKAGDLFITCINSPYYEEHIPSILREIVDLYHPEGFTDNSWSGPGRETICHCKNCGSRFLEKTGLELPSKKNWDDKAYREWIIWNYDRRLEIWDLNNRVVREAGGANCIWSGMNSGSVNGQCQSFRDYREICRRAEIIMLDSQVRSDEGGFQQNSITGKMIHGLLGWDKLVPESMAMYQAGRPTFRLSAKPAPEARHWMLEGIAGGIQPWWHHVGAYHEDRRMYLTAEPVMTWHQSNEPFLVNRTPVATVGVVWSQRNSDFYGRDHAELLAELPFRGITQALIRARIPFLPIHADDVEKQSEHLSLLILPNTGLLTAGQINVIRKFIAAGGNLLATGETSLYDEWGDPLPDFALADLFATHHDLPFNKKNTEQELKNIASTIHSYLRLLPALRAGVNGPHTTGEPPVTGPRHPVLKGFEETDILPFGGYLESLRTDSRAETLMTFIPAFPIYPPETAWMREPETRIPGLVLNTLPEGNRIAFLPADIDRQYARYNLPDHGNLLENLIRWAAKDKIPLSVEGHGLIDCQIYRQSGKLLFHLVNLTSSATWRQPIDKLIPAGPFRIKLKLPGDVKGKNIRLMVSGNKIQPHIKDGWFQFDIATVTDHEFAVIS